MANKHIMIVDGSTISREIVSRILNETLNNTQIDTCASGEEALARLGDHHYELITLSQHLPDMDGLELCRRIRSSDTSHQHVPVLLISTDSSNEIYRAGFAVGVTDYLEKSRGYKAFASYIKNLCMRTCGQVGRLLYVEDSLTAALVTKKVLTRHGIEVTHVTTAEEALTLLDKGGERNYDLIMSDFYLEGEMTGGDLLHHVRQILHLTPQEMPFLMVTGNEEKESQVEMVHMGANDFLTKPMIEEILMVRVRNLLTIRQQYEALQRQAQALEHAVNIDSLTGVHHFSYVAEQGNSYLRDPHYEPVWALILDLDSFETINLSQGHLTGDHILASVGKLLRESFGDGMVVRLGGKKFFVLLPLNGRKEALIRAETLRRRVAALNPDGTPITASIGLVCATEHPDLELAQILSLADKALDAAKGAGRNCIYLATPQKSFIPLKVQRSAS